MYSGVIVHNNSPEIKKNSSSTEKHGTSSGKNNISSEKNKGNNNKEQEEKCKSLYKEAFKTYINQTQLGVISCGVKSVVSLAKNSAVGAGLEFAGCMLAQQAGSTYLLSDKLDSINQECTILYQGDSVKDEDDEDTLSMQHGMSSREKDYSLSPQGQTVAINYQPNKRSEFELNPETGKFYKPSNTAIC
ncbi:hypothetical protein Cri9333_4997 (plasmid) [Crinalium epipsammum PCC 9333]|uniref:Uncharacterized protein n=1 Tax=Crinalium epipsammum PCC 9333 TaxID=1173022 RepID=K9W7P2_9CYAN|nr:hypothetical protein [Crinalium epipsammum]AFZ15752.1 hypothetical protein Cri9333_4997 [Crinalium epipsammum PCC 9333]